MSVLLPAARFFRKVNFKLKHYFFHSMHQRQFGFLSKKAHIENPLRLDGTTHMFIESGVFIHDQTWLGCYPMAGHSAPVFRVDQNSVIGHFCHISCVSKIHIAENVLIADYVTIADSTHQYEDITTPVIQQPYGLLREVTIGSGTWIADKCSILGANIGKQCVIGANSVVTRDIPDYCVAAGNPARIIKRYDPEKQQWITV